MGWKRKVVKVGNSLGVRIPNQIFQKTNFKEGDELEVTVEDDNSIKIKRAID